jgi:hypothetical protein
MADVTRTFSVEQIEDMGLTWRVDAPVVSTEEWDQHRWYTVRRVIFEFESQLWEIFYNDPATELQEGQDKFDEDPVTAYQVEPFQVTVTQYRRAVAAG